ncbi:hypothetical protein ACKI2N_015420 [Cupriavidus sp. 30B13]|uniref:hypothetical protein n=1 Tax=Cupriavidus sp. 30B13 TaxID=3384241 RepID=UPI003B912C7D
MNLRTIFFGTIALLSLAFGIKDLFHQAYFGAVSGILVAVSMGLIALTGESIFEESSLAQVIVLAAGALGIPGLFLDKSPFSVDKQRAHAELTRSFAELVADDRALRTPVEAQLAKAGLFACAGKEYSDLANVAMSAGKQIHLGPVTSTLDRTYSEALGTAPADGCLGAFRMLYKMNPQAFTLLEVDTAKQLLKDEG